MRAVERDERAIMEATVDALLAAGHDLTVFDSEEYTLRNGKDRRAILEAMRTTDDDLLIVDAVIVDKGREYESCESSFGWVRFVYGNDGWDVINDYTTNLEDVLAPVNALADSLS